MPQGLEVCKSSFSGMALLSSLQSVCSHALRTGDLLVPARTEHQLSALSLDKGVLGLEPSPQDSQGLLAGVLLLKRSSSKLSKGWLES